MKKIIRFIAAFIWSLFIFGCIAGFGIVINNVFMWGVHHPFFGIPLMVMMCGAISWYLYSTILEDWDD